MGVRACSRVFKYVSLHAEMCAAEYKFMLAHTCEVQRIRQDLPLELHQVS